MTDLTPGEAAILDLLATRRNGFTLEEVAEQCGTTKNSAKVMICKMRRKGCAIVSPLHISKQGPRKGVRLAYVLGGEA